MRISSMLWYFSKLPCGINHPTLEDVMQSPKDQEKKQDIKLILETSPTMRYDSGSFSNTRLLDSWDKLT